MELKKLFSTILLLTAIPCTLFAQPSVTGDTRFARGATMAFGRIKSISANGGSTITKRGFCIAENPNPTIDDSVSTKTISSNGTIYYFVNLKPSTKYYMRAYATNQSGVTGYGDVIKFYTLPKVISPIGITMAAVLPRTPASTMHLPMPATFSVTSPVSRRSSMLAIAQALPQPTAITTMSLG